MAVKNTLRIRFTFNRAKVHSAGPMGSIEVKRKTDTFASIVIRDVAIRVAAGKYQNLRDQIRNDIEPTMRRELHHLAKQYLQFVVGKQRVGGTLTTVVKGDLVTKGGGAVSQDSYALRDALPKWDDLSPKYLARKTTRPNWFKYKGSINESNISGAAWEQMFGPVRVTVQPAKNIDAKLSAARRASAVYTQGGRGTKTRVGVATVRASVFGQLTPSMVAALADGNMSKSRQTADGRTSGLLDKVAAVSQGLAWRLGHNSKPGHVYRPSLEPFLAFAVTRSIPAAISAKLVQRGYK